MAEKIKAIMILEILGKPKNYVKKILTDIVKKLGGEEGVKILKKNIAAPKSLETDAELFTSFAEIEVETNLQKLMFLLFYYMPSHVEIIEPEELKISHTDLNLFFGELSKKLHQYDELAKTMMMERKALDQKMQELGVSGEELNKKIAKKQKAAQKGVPKNGTRTSGEVPSKGNKKKGKKV